MTDAELDTRLESLEQASQDIAELIVTTRVLTSAQLFRVAQKTKSLNNWIKAWHRLVFRELFGDVKAV
jgi:hypothetical protein